MAMDGVELKSAPRSVVKPEKLAHFVLRTGRFDEMLNWYKTVFDAEARFENDILAFLSYDEEHHRIALINMPGLTDQPEGAAGVHHVAFTFDSLQTLAGNYEVLRDKGILPVYVINHGPTTSLYYADPDGNQLEFQVDNYPTVEEATEFFFSPSFAENPIGVEFDPEELVRRLKAGEPEENIKRRPDVGPQGLANVKLK